MDRKKMSEIMKLLYGTFVDELHPCEQKLLKGTTCLGCYQFKKVLKCFDSGECFWKNQTDVDAAKNCPAVALHLDANMSCQCPNLEKKPIKDRSIGIKIVNLLEQAVIKGDIKDVQYYLKELWIIYVSQDETKKEEEDK